MNATTPAHRCDWMLPGPFGVMVHWLAPGPAPEHGPRIEELDRAVEKFSVDRFFNDVLTTGAKWILFTFGQNTGMYCSPNTVFETACGAGVCSERDLVLEIASRAHAEGLRFIGYLPCEVAANTRMHAGMGWNTQNGTDQAEFQRRYTAAIAEWGLRLGPLMDGWWFDGCYAWEIFENRHMNWPLWYQCARAGNEMRAVAFNDGCFINGSDKPTHPDQDFLSGEIEALVDGKIRLTRERTGNLYLPRSRFIEGTGCQWHALLPIDAFWWHGGCTEKVHRESTSVWGLPFKLVASDNPGPMEEPVYTDAELALFLGRVRAVDGAVTLNAGIYQEGHLGPRTVDQLARIPKSLR